jgi:hypothetical protein
MGYPSIVMIAILLIGFAFKGRLLFYLLFAVGSFTSLSLVPPEVFGGLTVQSQTVFLLGLIFKTMPKRYAGLSAAQFSAILSKLGLLFAFLAAAIVISIVSPLLFAGDITVVPMRIDDDFETSILVPTVANLTQCAYLTASVLAAATIAVLAMNPKFIGWFVMSLLIGGLVVIATGIADIIFGESGALAPFRNASYSLHESDSVGGMKRVIGLTPEASAFGWNCMYFAAMLLFLRPIVPRQSFRGVIVIVILLLILMAVLSTSSTAYLWIISLAACYVSDFAMRCFRPTANKGKLAAMGIECYLIILLLVIGAAILMFGEGVYDRACEALDAILFKKTESDSFFGRSFWNETSLAAFTSSHGLGVGVGSTRSSSTYIGLLSNTGVVGTILFGLFLLRIFMTKGHDTQSNTVIRGLKFVLLSYGPAWVINGGPDFGPNFGAVFGAIVGLSVARETGAIVVKRLATSSGSGGSARAIPTFQMGRLRIQRRPNYCVRSKT